MDELPSFDDWCAQNGIDPEPYVLESITEYTRRLAKALKDYTTAMARLAYQGQKP